MKLALAMCVLAAIAYGFGAILQALGARRAVQSSESGISKVTRQPLFLGGVALDLSAWVISRFALHTLPLFAVQTVLAGSLAITVVLARFFLGSELRRADQIAVGLTMIGLTVVGISAGEETSSGLTHGLKVAVLLAMPALGFIGFVLIRLGKPIMLAVLSGAAFTGSALAARAVEFKHVTLANFVSKPLVWAVIIYAVMALVFHAVALTKGDVGGVTAAMWATEVVVATVVGAVLLDDHMRPGWQIPAIAGIAVTLAATVILARSPAQDLHQRLSTASVSTE